MRKRIPINNLLLGMYIDGMDAEWFNTPFLVHKFALKDRSQIDKLIKTGITHVFIDTEKGRDILSASDARASGRMESVERRIPVPDKAAQDAVETASVDKAATQPREQTDGLPYTSREVINYYEFIDNFTQIDRETLVKGAEIDFSLYLKQALKIDRIAEYAGKSVELTPDILNVKGEFMINRDDNRKYKGYLKELVRTCGRGFDKAALTVRNMVIKENSKLLMQELFDDPRSGKAIQECKGSVEDIIGSIQDNRHLLSEMLTINKYDHYTYTHSVNVSVLSLGMAIELGIKDIAELRVLGMGGMLHDIGKSKIPASILNKPGRLTDEEFAVIKQHVVLGKRLLADNVEIPQSVLGPLMQHHERLTGKGYPFGLSDGQISVIGRIVAIADTYDALTTARPYKDAMKPFEALKILRDQIADYDGEIFQKFVMMLGGLM